MAEELTRWTVRLSLAFYIGRIALDLAPRPATARRDRLSRGLWTTGCLFLWLHVGCAFQFYHHWSHKAAFESTARETAETMGLAWGGGLYFNYAFMLLWAGDAAWWWLSPASYRRRSRFISYTLHAYLAFIAFNATVVFESGPVRYAGLGAAGLVVFLALRSRLN